MNDVFLSGALGLVGSYVTKAATTRWPSTRIWQGTRSVAPRPNANSSGLSETSDYRWSFSLDVRRDIRLPDGIETVIHMAGEKRDLARMQAVNADGTRRLILAAKASGVRRFVHLSSAGVYGAKPHAGTVTEDTPHRPANTYESTKDAAESCVRSLCPQLGMDFVVLQPTTVLALSSSVFPLRGLISAIRRNRFAFIGSDEVWLNYVAAHDVAAAVIVGAESAPPNGVYILNTPARLRELVQWIAEELGVSTPERHLPLWAGSALARLGTSLQKLMKRSMPFHNERFQELTNTTVFDGSLITRATSFRYQYGIEQFVRELVRSYLSDGRV